MVYLSLLELTKNFAILVWVLLCARRHSEDDDDDDENSRNLSSLCWERRQGRNCISVIIRKGKVFFRYLLPYLGCMKPSQLFTWLSVKDAEEASRR